MSKRRTEKDQQNQTIDTLLFGLLETQRLAVRLFDQQMWCWGQDVIGFEGSNLLLEYGCTRVPSPDGKDRSRYEFYESENSVILWGFALWYTHTSIGSLLLKRHDFRPRVNLTSTTTPAIWRLIEPMPAQYPITELERSAAVTLSVEVLRFISQYEAWVVERAGLAHRQRVIGAYPDRRKGYIPAEDMAATWTRLVNDCQHLPIIR